jgi:hypothetical protein
MLLRVHVILQDLATVAGRCLAAAITVIGTPQDPQNGTPTAQAMTHLKSARAGQTLDARSGKTLGGGGRRKGMRV